MSKGADKFADKNTKSEYTYIHGVQLQKRKTKIAFNYHAILHIVTQYRINSFIFMKHRIVRSR